MLREGTRRHLPGGRGHSHKAAGMGQSRPHADACRAGTVTAPRSRMWASGSCRQPWCPDKRLPVPPSGRATVRHVAIRPARATSTGVFPRHTGKRGQFFQRQHGRRRHVPGNAARCIRPLRCPARGQPGRATHDAPQACALRRHHGGAGVRSTRLTVFMAYPSSFPYL